MKCVCVILKILKTRKIFFANPLMCIVVALQKNQKMFLCCNASALQSQRLLLNDDQNPRHQSAIIIQKVKNPVTKNIFQSFKATY